MNHLLKYSVITAVFVAVVIFMFSSGGTSAQEANPTSTPAVPSTTGKLVVTPDALTVGQTAEAVGFHVEPTDAEVRIEYSEHFVPQGESCPTSSSGTTTAAVAPTWITLRACSAGSAQVRLVASDTGLTIDQLTVTITEAPTGATGQVDESPRIRLSGVASTLTEGDTDSFTVEVMGLTTTESYNLYTVPLNYNLAFNTDCDDHEQLESLSGRSSYTISYTVHACSSPGSYLWSYLRQGNSYPATSGATNNYVSVSAPQATPEVTISSSGSSVTEGQNIVFTVTASTATSSPLTLNVEVTESGAFIDGTPATSVTIPANGTTASFTVQTDDDSVDESDGSVTASIQAPTGYDLGSPSSVTVPVTDNDGSTSSSDPEVTISSSQTSVTEGQSIRFTVTADTAPSSNLTVSVQLTDSGAFLDYDETRRFTVTIPANRTSVSFTVGTNNDGVDESNGTITAQLWAGTGYDLGSSYSISVTVEDNDEPAVLTPGGTWTTTLTSAYDSQSNEYGYYRGEYGTLSNQAFRYDGVVYIVDYIYWYGSSGNLEFGVDGCLKPTDFVSLSIGSSTYFGSPRRTGAECDVDATQRQEFEVRNVTSNPLTQPGTYQITVALARDAITPIATAEADTQELFIGQSVTMTASASSAFGTVSSHQWQEWSSGQWTDLASATSSTHVVTSSVSGVRTFRVRATSSSGTTALSSPAGIQWKPMVVTVTASPENPESDDATKRTVTLTATSDAPTSVTYQWQQGNGTNWTNLGASSMSASKTVSFTTRGTRKFRVRVSHAVAPSVESEPIYVTWDEWSIVSDMVTELVSAVATSTNYRTAQTALLSCMNGTSGGASGATGPSSNVPTPSTYNSFDNLLVDYRGSTKAKMDTGKCSIQTATMFSTVQDLFRAKLTTLKSSNTEYAALLETPQGRDFEAKAGSTDEFGKNASHLATVIALGQAAGPSGAVGGSSGTAHGFESCLPSDINPTLEVKFDTLNCLQFQKSHSLWVTLHGSQTKQTALKRELDRYSWLQYDNFACSNWILPDPGRALPCLKQDIAYASLQRLIADTGQPSATLDVAWNPRNKYLADHFFVIDGICGMDVGEQRRDCIPQAASDHSVVATLFHTGWWLPKISHFGVSEFNDKGWPITQQDVNHARENLEYLSCNIPNVSQVVMDHGTGRRFDVRWSLNHGCVDAIVIDSYRICYEVSYSNLLLGFIGPSETCAVMEVSDSPGSFNAPIGTQSVTLKSMQLRPGNRINPRISYPKTVFLSQIPVYHD